MPSAFKWFNAFGVQMFNYSNVQLFYCSMPAAFKKFNAARSRVQMPAAFRCSIIQMFYCSIVQCLRRLKSSMLRVQVFNYSNVQLFNSFGV
jgi:hypothetical protein